MPNDPSIVNPNTSFTTASPTENTVYTVTSLVPRNRNLIDNGDFEKGDVAFESQYTGYPYPPNPANPGFAQRAYSIVYNGRQFEPQFQLCTDHTSGSGRMMAIDGATVPNLKIWSQKVSVTPNTTYTVQYWLQSIDPNSPAQLELQMNGTPITGNTATSTSTASATACLWQQASYSWNSGSNTTAELSIIGRNLSSFGNDFAIDDVSMTHPVSCTFSKSTAITVIPGPFANAGPDKSIIAGDEVTLDGTGTSNPTSIAWTPNTNITGANTYTPSVNPSTTTTYVLSVRGNNNCVSTDNVLVTVLPYCIKVMDAFTPNGDGMNDRWLVVNNGGVCARQILVSVFNRYGSLVYKNDNYNNDWTGIYKGKPIPDGTYYYVVSYQLLTGAYLKLKGDVTILR
jgi:gliding motility-associated-like protein